MTTVPSPLRFCPHCNTATTEDGPTCKNCGRELAIVAVDPNPESFVFERHAPVDPNASFTFQTEYDLPQPEIVPSKPKTILDIFLFEGRASRQEFWWTLLAINFIYFSWLLGMLLIYWMIIREYPVRGLRGLEDLGSPLFIGSIWVAVAVQIRRWHDLEKSALWALVAFVPPATFYAIYQLGFVAGKPGPNKYGNDPFGYRRYLRRY